MSATDEGVVDHQEPDLPVQARSDAEFIAHARTDIPELLDENEQLRAELDRLDDLVDYQSMWVISRLRQEHARLTEALAERDATIDAIRAAAKGPHKYEVGALALTVGRLYDLAAGADTGHGDQQ